MMKLPRSLVAILLLAAAPTAGLFGQAAPAKIDFPQASPAATIKQRVGVTDFEINYSRPSAKGRKMLGGQNAYGEVWRTGANSATKIQFTTPVKFNGTEVPAGSYELFTIPGPTQWTIILHKDTSQWGAYTYNAKNDVARVTTTAVAASTPLETFTISFGDLRDESATLYLAWETTVVPVKLEVSVGAALVPQIETVMASDAAKKPYAQAAMYYLDHDLDLNKAAAWMESAIKENPAAFYLGYHHARILAKQGNKAGALAAAQKALTAAKQQTGALKDEYVRLNEALIERLNKS